MPFPQKNLPFVFLPFLLGGVFLLYFPGVSGALYYDDAALDPLKTLKWGDWEAMLAFVALGDTGPLGRPLSLISFLLNMGDLPLQSDRILLFNVILHLLNGVLVFLLAFQLSQFYESAEKENHAWIALGAAALWLIFPLQVSTNLIAVQRMASLSAFFVFAGLVVYLHGLARQIDKNKGLVLQITGMVLFTWLAVFSKENGALLPIFAWVLEITLLKNVAPKRKNYRIAALAFTLFILLISMANEILKTGFFNTIPGRDFSIAERLMTESLILFDYVRQAFLPSTFSIHPFHDNYPVTQSLLENPKAFIAVLIWFLLITSALVWRKRFTVFSFVVLWFFIAHLLESTTFSLELYFEHRNYVALFGPALGILLLLKKVPLAKQRIAMGGFAAYLLLLSSILYSTTSLWGNQELAAQVWFDNREPHSVRSGSHLFEDLQQSDLLSALAVTEKIEKACPLCFVAAIQSLSFACGLEDKEKTAAVFSRATALASDPKRIGGFASPLYYFVDLLVSGKCKLVSYDQLSQINQLLLANKNKPLDQESILYLHLNQYKIFIAQNNKEKAFSELQQAWQTTPQIAMEQGVIGFLLDINRIEEAEAFFATSGCENLPWHPIKAMEKTRLCTQTRGNIDKAIAVYLEKPTFLNKVPAH